MSLSLQEATLSGAESISEEICSLLQRVSEAKSDEASSCSTAVGENADSNQPIAEDDEEEEVCPICLLEMVDGESLLTCKEGCHNRLHLHCLKVCKYQHTSLSFYWMRMVNRGVLVTLSRRGGGGGGALPSIPVGKFFSTP